MRCFFLQEGCLHMGCHLFRYTIFQRLVPQQYRCVCVCIYIFKKDPRVPGEVGLYATCLPSPCHCPILSIIVLYDITNLIEDFLMDASWSWVFWGVFPPFYHPFLFLVVEGMSSLISALCFFFSFAFSIPFPSFFFSSPFLFPQPICLKPTYFVIPFAAILA